MTGPEHYREAEALLASAAATVDQYGDGAEGARQDLAAAQAHATLALVAATAAQLTDRYVGDGYHINAWCNVHAGGPVRPIVDYEDEDEDEVLPILAHEHRDIDAGGNCKDVRCGYNADAVLSGDDREPVAIPDDEPDWLPVHWLPRRFR